MPRTLPIFLLVLAAVTTTFAAPGPMALDREALAAGQLWRLWSGHLVHWNASHLIWDGLTFCVLALLLERLAPRVLAQLVILGSPIISLCVLLADPRLRLYGGLSGLDVALWVAVCLAVARHHRADRTTRALGWLALTGGLLKVGFEIATGSTVFVDGAFAPVPSAHLSGAAIGWLAIGWFRATSNSTLAANAGLDVPAAGTAVKNSTARVPGKRPSAAQLPVRTPQ